MNGVVTQAIEFEGVADKPAVTGNASTTGQRDGALVKASHSESQQAKTNPQGARAHSKTTAIR